CEDTRRASRALITKYRVIGYSSNLVVQRPTCTAIQAIRWSNAGVPRSGKSPQRCATKASAPKSFGVICGDRAFVRKWRRGKNADKSRECRRYLARFRRPESQPAQV